MHAPSILWSENNIFQNYLVDPASRILTMAESEEQELHNITENKLHNTTLSDNSEMVDRFSFGTNQDLSCVDQRISSHLAVDRERDLPVDFEPDDWTVICSRGLTSFHHGKFFRFL
jgi:hypothetical protein